MPNIKDVMSSLAADGFRDVDARSIQILDGSGCSRCGDNPCDKVLGFATIFGQTYYVCADRAACHKRTRDADRAKGRAETERVSRVEAEVTL